MVKAGDHFKEDMHCEIEESEVKDAEDDDNVDFPEIGGTEAPGTTDLAQHHIKLTSDVPVRSRPYPVPYSMRESLKKDITDMIKMGVIRESDSPYASPVVVVKKKNNTNRVCVDYQELNKLTAIS